MKALLLVMAGSALGGGARYLVTTTTTRWFGTGFPIGTGVVNVVGSFVLVLLLALTATGATDDDDAAINMRLFFATGVLGGFTTYSSFNAETIKLVQDGAVGLAAFNVVATVVLCLLAGLAALAVARALAP